MFYTIEQARTQRLTAQQLIAGLFPAETEHASFDAEFLTADRATALGFAGLSYEAPVCAHLLASPAVNAWVAGKGSLLIVREADGTLRAVNEQGNVTLDAAVTAEINAVYERVLASVGTMNDKGEVTYDLKAYSVGPHYAVNLLLGNRMSYPHPLVTTPKSALDALGRGSFRATGGTQVLATRYTLHPEQAGEPANRQFYLVENGRQIFYSADVRKNVKSAACTHSQSRSVIRYETECGLEITRTIFILPQEDGMPTAVEAQRVTVRNLTDKPRQLSIVMTGVFGISGPDTIANDVVYANVVVESEVFYQEGRPAAMTLHHQPSEEHHFKRFATLLCGGETFDSFCASQADFIGSGTLEEPELAAHLPNRYQRKMTPFFAMGKALSVAPGETAVVDEFVGMLEGSDPEVDPAFDAALHALLTKYADPAALTDTLGKVVAFWDQYTTYLRPELQDERFNTYVRYDLPFQVLYQTYVSRAFAWTQKSYREIGFREIQDIYASMYYLSAMGQNGLIRELLSNWVKNVFRMGYANHNFTIVGKEPGDCSDDQLWLAQAVYRYVTLTGDHDFLLTEYPVAGEDGTRPLWETLMAILRYSGDISVGKHGLPLLDKADWNDTLRLDHGVLNGPAKEATYRRQLAEKNQPFGSWWENDLSESVMNACLLIIAADEVAEMAKAIGKEEDGQYAAKLAERVRSQTREHAWKGDFYARCLINDNRPYTYLGSTGDGLNADPAMPGTYFLNAYSWTILAGVATEEQIAAMLGPVEKYLKTDAGLKLCTIVDFDRLKIKTGTALYFPGDRENGGVFKHAAMMATTASLQAAKAVKDEALALRLRDLAAFMLDKVLPYKTLDNPFVLKGNPRFCTQYNNSQTCENIGPMLSGTASWLTLAIYELLGATVGEDAVVLSPVMLPDQQEMRYTLRPAGCELQITVTDPHGRMRPGEATRVTVDGAPASLTLPRFHDGQAHVVNIEL